MNIETLKNYCLSKKAAQVDFPFDASTMVFKVASKMFALTDIEDNENELRVNLKCSPDLALDLREEYKGVLPGWHMNKKHWNTVMLNEDVPEETIFKMIDHSYELVYKSLKKSEKELIELKH